MAAPGGGRLWSQAWKWFTEKAAIEEAQDLRANVGHLPAVPEPLKEIYQALPDVSGSVICFGCTGYIGEAVVFDAVRRGLDVTVFIRQKSVDRFSGLLEELKILDRVSLVVGDATVKEDVEKAMKQTSAQCCISLLAAAAVDNEESIHKVDWVASHTVLMAARKCGIKQFIYCSDTGCYQPALACQMHKLRMEGELMRCLPDGMQYTIVRPTTYHPYVVSPIQFADIRHGKNVSLFGTGDSAGELAVYNPIAREDLGRFIVSCVMNSPSYGRVMAVGGPWSEDNISSLGDTAKWMIEFGTPADTKPSKITPLGMDLSKIIYRFMETVGHVSKTLKKVATIVFYYTKYWSSVSHFSPGTGVYPVKDFTKSFCKEVAKDPAAFEDFVKKAKSDTASVVYPMPRLPWWDIRQPSLLPDQIPMGAGKTQKVDLTHLRSHISVGRISLGGVLDDDESFSDVPDSDGEDDGEWVSCPVRMM